MPLDRVVFRGEVPSTSRARAGKLYQVTIYASGEGICACLDWILKGGNAGNLFYRCKHVASVIATQRLKLPGQASQPGQAGQAAGAPVGGGPERTAEQGSPGQTKPEPASFARKTAAPSQPSQPAPPPPPPPDPEALDPDWFEQVASRD